MVLLSRCFPGYIQGAFPEHWLPLVTPAPKDYHLAEWLSTLLGVLEGWLCSYLVCRRGTIYVGLNSLA